MMSGDATIDSNDVTSQKELKPPSKPLNPREEMMNLVISNTRESRDQELSEAQQIDEESESIPAPPPPPPKKPPENDQNETIEAVNIAPPSVDNDEIVTNNALITRDGQQFLISVVNGERRETPLPEVITRIQKEYNAEEQTRLAVEARKQYEQRFAELQNANQSLPTPRRDATPVDRETRKRELEKAFHKLYEDGDVRNSAEIVDALLETTAQSQVIESQPSLSRDDVLNIVRQAEPELESQRSLRMAWDEFKSNETYGFIAQDPTLKAKLDAITEDLQNNPEFIAKNPTFDDFFKEAGNQVIKWVNNINGTPAAVDTLNETVERKRAVSPSVSSRTIRRSTPPETPPPTNSDIIAAIKRSRGQTDF